MIKEAADKTDRVRLKVGPPLMSEITYSTPCGKFLPILTESYSDAYIADRKDYKIIQQMMAAPPGPYYDHPRINQIADRIGRGVEEAALAKRSPKEALDAAAADVDRIMTRR